MTAKRVIIMAGGTGGHVFPALAVAVALRERGSEVLWLGTRGRLEEQLVPRAGFEIAYLDVRGIRRNGLKAKLTAPFMVAHAVWQARRVFKQFRPEVVLGFGGYASAPGGMAAFLMGIPVLLHEQNAASGLTNRILFRLCTRALIAFPGTFEGSKVIETGNPVRAEIAALHGKERDFYAHDKLRVLIVGGSLGASALNEKVPAALKLCTAPLKVVHQCGRGHLEAAQQAYQGAGFEYEVSEFITDMASAYRNADLIICRAGALTVAETAAARLPAIFVPLPSAVDDHQTKNAKSLVKLHAAYLISQARLSAEELGALVDSLAVNRAELDAMSRRLADAAVLDATDRIIAELDQAAK